MTLKRCSHSPMCSGEIVPFQWNFTAFTLMLIATLRKAPVSDNVALATGGLPCANASHGLWLEFGVYQGKTIQIMANYRRNHVLFRPAVYGFDSFLGLPEDWRHVWRPLRGNTLRKAASMSRGAFATAGKPPKLPAHLEPLVGWEVGWYNESLPRFLLSHDHEPVTLLHIDCDLYTSTKTVFNFLAAQLHSGSVLVFDELFNFPEYQAHEVRALWEFLRDNDYDVEVLATSTHDISFEPRTESFKQSCALRLMSRGCPHELE